VFSRSAGEGSIACRQKLEMIEVSAGEAERTFLFFESDPGAGAEFFAALVTLGIPAMSDEDFDFVIVFGHDEFGGRVTHILGNVEGEK